MKKNWPTSRNTSLAVCQTKSWNRHNVVKGSCMHWPHHSKTCMRRMLRRNIKPSLGLVNGATGVLVKIECDDKDQPYALRIKFDKIEKEQLIVKVSSTFQQGPDSVQTRRQFPVTMAFAATAHKCQGLTLKNALISTRRLFAAGQAFVAMSRVRAYI